MASTRDQLALTIYSPAPPGTTLHAHNEELGAMLAASGIDCCVVAVALPQSIDRICELDGQERSRHLPIVTTVDFLPAIAGGGPALHAYNRANDGLKFVSSLYDVAFGVLAFDPAIASAADLKGRRVGAPTRHSSVRVLSEALLRDGWGIRDDVEIVEIPPHELVAAIAERRIDATTWNVMSITADGALPTIPQLLNFDGAHWIDVEEDAVASINAANGFRTEATCVEASRIIGVETSGDASHSLLSFRQALAAWETTPIETVQAILACIEAQGAKTRFLPRNRREMMHWPHLSDELVHAGAIEFLL